MTGKTIPFKTPVPMPQGPEQWVHSRDAESAAAKPAEPTKRLTVDIPETLHRRIKLDSVTRGLLISDVIRALLDQAYPAQPKAS